jgi:hypothetical protein
MKTEAEVRELLRRMKSGGHIFEFDHPYSNESAIDVGYCLAFFEWLLEEAHPEGLN